MQVQEIFCEDAMRDVSMNKRAHDAAIAVSHGIYRGVHIEFETQFSLDDTGEDFYGFHASHFGLQPECLLLFGLRNQKAIGMSGMVANFSQPVLGCDFGVFIRAMREMTPEELKRATNSTEFLEVFSHEWLHVLDNDRTNRKIIAKPYTNDDNTPYYNSPAEFNAYFHDIARNWLGLSAEALKSPENAKDLMDLYGVTGDLKTDLQRILRPTRIHYHSFLKHLTPERRRALLRRLYKVHSEMMRIVTQAETAVPHERNFAN